MAQRRVEPSVRDAEKERRILCLPQKKPRKQTNEKLEMKNERKKVSSPQKLKRLTRKQNDNILYMNH